MVVQRGEVWWADLGEPRESGPGLERPVLVIQADDYNKTKISTVIVAIITSNLRMAKMPGNVTLTARASGLENDSVVNVTQLFTLDKTELFELTGILSETKLEQIDAGLRSVLSL